MEVCGPLVGVTGRGVGRVTEEDVGSDSVAPGGRGRRPPPPEDQDGRRKEVVCETKSSPTSPSDSTRTGNVVTLFPDLLG